MESNLSNIWLIFYMSTWIVTIVVYQKKKRHFDVGSVLLFSHLLYSIVSWFLYNSPYYYFDRIRLFPFIYLYFMLMLAFLPILKYDVRKIEVIKKPNLLLLNVICIIFIIASLVQLPNILSNIAFSINKLLTDPAGGQDLYNMAMSTSYTIGDGKISNFPSIISNAFGNFGILLFFYYLTLKKYNRLIVLGLSISCLVAILTNISLGQRGPLVEIAFSVIVTYYAIKKFIQPKNIKIIRLVVVSLIIAVSVPIFALTKSRFGKMDGGSFQSIYYYVGQENLYFNNYGLDNGGLRYGDRTFPLFKRIMGFDNVPRNFMERREKYSSQKISDEMFIGFVGDFTLDFGPIVAPILFIAFTIIVLKKTKLRNGKLLFHQLILIHFVLSLCMLGGIKLYPYSDVGGNLQLIVYVIAYFYFRISYGLCQKNDNEHRLDRS